VIASKIGATDIQKTAIAISAFTSENLSNSASSTIQDIADFTPGLSIAEAKGGNARIYIRGI
jgi:iron complex outermembrane receptor protein